MWCLVFNWAIINRIRNSTSNYEHHSYKHYLLDLLIASMSFLPLGFFFGWMPESISSEKLKSKNFAAWSSVYVDSWRTHAYVVGSKPFPLQILSLWSPVRVPSFFYWNFKHDQINTSNISQLLYKNACILIPLCSSSTLNMQKGKPIAKSISTYKTTHIMLLLANLMLVTSETIQYQLGNHLGRHRLKQCELSDRWFCIGVAWG